MSDTEYRTYRTVTEAEVAEIASTWDRQERLARHTSRWLMEHRIIADADKDDDQNLNDYADLLDRVLDAAR